jgi:hypothetical protein
MKAASLEMTATGTAYSLQLFRPRWRSTAHNGRSRWPARRRATLLNCFVASGVPPSLKHAPDGSRRSGSVASSRRGAEESRRETVSHRGIGLMFGRSAAISGVADDLWRRRPTRRCGGGTEGSAGSGACQRRIRSAWAFGRRVRGSAPPLYRCAGVVDRMTPTHPTSSIAHTGKEAS